MKENIGVPFIEMWAIAHKSSLNKFVQTPIKGTLPTLGYRQAVRHKTLTLACDSSNLSTPAKSILWIILR